MIKVILIILLLTFAIFILNNATPASKKGFDNQTSKNSAFNIKPSPKSTPKVNIISPKESKVIPIKKHIYQTFNNCGPAILAMALSYFGIDKSQEELGQKLRPYQNPKGDNDDKSVTLAEVAVEAKNYNLIPYLRPNGNIEKIKLFISNDIPVITRTWLKKDGDIGHYRIIRGFDDTRKELIQDDSLQNKDLHFTYSDYLDIWKPFNYEYLVLVPIEKKDLAESILGAELDEKVAWQNSLKRVEQELEKDPENIHLQFNLSLNYFHLGNYQKSVEAFEKVENKLSFRTLWYQIEPIIAYQKLKNYDRVFQLTDKILNNHNRAFSELYQIRGEIYLEQGKRDLAKEEFEKAVSFNQNFEKAKLSLSKID